MVSASFVTGFIYKCCEILKGYVCSDFKAVMVPFHLG